MLAGGIAAGSVVFIAATDWRGGDANDNGPALRVASRAQAQQCLTAKGLHVKEAGSNSLRVTGPSRIDVELTFYPTFDQAQSAAVESSHGRAPVSRKGAVAGAMDTVAYRARFALDDPKFRLFSDCVGHQPVQPNS